METLPRVLFWLGIVFYPAFMAALVLRAHTRTRQAGPQWD